MGGWDPSCEYRDGDLKSYLICSLCFMILRYGNHRRLHSHLGLGSGEHVMELAMIKCMGGATFGI